MAEYLEIKPQNVTDGLSGKSRSMAELLAKNGFEKVLTAVPGVPKAASIRRKKFL